MMTNYVSLKYNFYKTIKGFIKLKYLNKAYLIFRSYAYLKFSLLIEISNQTFDMLSAKWKHNDTFNIIIVLLVFNIWFWLMIFYFQLANKINRSILVQKLSWEI